MTGLFHEFELKLAQLIQVICHPLKCTACSVPVLEGVMAAIRAARTFTKKKYVIKVGGAYHGWIDGMYLWATCAGTAGWKPRAFRTGTSADAGILPNSSLLCAGI